MKAALLLLIVALFVSSVSASPLVFKTVKVIDSPDSFVELFTIDTSRFRDLRLHVLSTDDKFDIVVWGVEDDDLILIDGGHLPSPGFLQIRSKFLISTPPAKLRVTVKGKGTFKAFVWGQ